MHICQALHSVQEQFAMFRLINNHHSVPKAEISVAVPQPWLSKTVFRPTMPKYAKPNTFTFKDTASPRESCWKITAQITVLLNCCLQ